MDDPFSDEYKSDMGITPDGYASELIGFTLKGLMDATHGNGRN
jgi:hypothetical protein